MSERLYGLVDMGATQRRVLVVDGDMSIVGQETDLTTPEDYEGSIYDIADTIDRYTEDDDLVAVSVAIAGELDDEGRLIRAGDLTPWVGRYVSRDLAAALGLPDEQVGSMNDVAAAAYSQAEADKQNGLEEDSMIFTLSSGWGGARITSEGLVVPDEPGHQYLRDGAVCPCGGVGHTEAFISGKGVLKNHGVSMSLWLERSGAADEFVADVTDSTVEMLERHKDHGFNPSVLRWMGGVAAGQPLHMWRAYQGVRRRLGANAPAWEAVTLGHQAGLHGTFVRAKQLANAA
jgi:predicted NBD/HSP70 family sugar kinase